MANVPKVFISSTSQDLSSSRDILRLAANDMDWMPVEQKHFPPDYRALRDMLRAKIKECDAVIVLIGLMYGSEPESGHKDGTRRSYTQLEYEFALELKRPVFVFFCEADYPFDCQPGEEPEELRKLQDEHRQRVVQSDRKREVLHNKAELSEKVRTLELFLREAREGRKKKGCTIRFAVVMTLCLLIWMGLLLEGARERAPSVAVKIQQENSKDSNQEAKSPKEASEQNGTRHRGLKNIPVAAVADGKRSEEFKGKSASSAAVHGRAVVYRVDRTDTLFSISRMFQISVKDLLAANPRLDPKDLGVGAELMIPMNAGNAAAFAPASPSGNETKPVVSPAAAKDDRFPIAKKTDTPGRVISPFSPYSELNVDGLISGELALDPVTGKVFRVP